MQHELEFKPIRLPEFTEICLRFTADAYVCSYGHEDRFRGTDGKGPERYLEWLKAKIDANPATAVHVWRDGVVIGQIELGLFNLDPTIGYVCLYYLVPEARGNGIGEALDRYAREVLRRLGVSAARLSVSPTNSRAISFYKKMGWREIGPYPNRPEVQLMGCELI